MSRSVLVTSICNTITAAMVAGAQVRADEDQFFVVEHSHQTINHSPQTPGFTSWVGDWTLPDSSLVVSFTQV